jgi:Na+/melibiose symporter-like transporter
METLPVVNAFGGGSHAWTITFTIFGIVAAILFFITFKTTKERVQPSVKVEKAVQIKVGVKALFKNKYWFLMLIFTVFAYISLGLGGANVYYVQYVLGDTGLMETLTTAQLIPMLVASDYRRIKSFKVINVRINTGKWSCSYKETASFLFKGVFPTNIQIQIFKIFQMNKITIFL